MLTGTPNDDNYVIDVDNEDIQLDLEKFDFDINVNDTITIIWKHRFEVVVDEDGNEEKIFKTKTYKYHEISSGFNLYYFVVGDRDGNTKRVLFEWFM